MWEYSQFNEFSVNDFFGYIHLLTVSLNAAPSKPGLFAKVLDTQELLQAASLKIKLWYIYPNSSSTAIRSSERGFSLYWHKTLHRSYSMITQKFTMSCVSVMIFVVFRGVFRWTNNFNFGRRSVMGAAATIFPQFSWDFGTAGSSLEHENYSIRSATTLIRWKGDFSLNTWHFLMRWFPLQSMQRVEGDAPASTAGLHLLFCMWWRRRSLKQPCLGYWVVIVLSSWFHWCLFHQFTCLDLLLNQLFYWKSVGFTQWVGTEKSDHYSFILGGNCSTAVLGSKALFKSTSNGKDLKTPTRPELDAEHDVLLSLLCVFR